MLDRVGTAGMLKTASAGMLGRAGMLRMDHTDIKQILGQKTVST